MLQTIFGMMFVRLVLRLIDGVIEWATVLLWLTVAALVTVGRWIARGFRTGPQLRPYERPGARRSAH